MEEKWKSIKGYEGEYSISTLGRVRNDRTGRIRKQFLDSEGSYYSVTLPVGDPSKRKFLYIHRLMAETFIPQEEGKTVVDHIDKNTRNNSLENLRWVTPSENNVNSTRHKKPRRVEVEQWTLDGHYVATYSSYYQACQKTGINTGSIGKCAKGKRKSAGGYFWRIAD